MFVAMLGIVKGFSQQADLQSFIWMDTLENPFIDTVDRTNNNAVTLNAGQSFTPNLDFYYTLNHPDSIFSYWGAVNNGPDALDANSVVTYVSSFSRFLTQAEAQAEGVPFYTHPDSPRYMWTYGSTLANPVDVDGYVIARSYDEVDSIGLLGDWQRWVDSSQLRLKGQPYEPYVVGQSYAFFFRVYGMGSSSAPTNIDNRPRNNVYVQKIIWNGNSGVGIKDMIVKQKNEKLNVYPNPATNQINFSYTFKENTLAQLMIRDITGRVVAFENFGRQVVGEKTFSYDISKLAAGNYTVEFSTPEIKAVSKLTVK